MHGENIYVRKMKIYPWESVFRRTLEKTSERLCGSEFSFLPRKNTELRRSRRNSISNENKISSSWHHCTVSKSESNRSQINHPIIFIQKWNVNKSIDWEIKINSATSFDCQHGSAGKLKYQHFHRRWSNETWWGRGRSDDGTEAPCKCQQYKSHRCTIIHVCRIQLRVRLHMKAKKIPEGESTTHPMHLYSFLFLLIRKNLAFHPWHSFVNTFPLRCLFNNSDMFSGHWCRKKYFLIIIIRCLLFFYYLQCQNPSHSDRKNAPRQRFIVVRGTRHKLLFFFSDYFIVLDTPKIDKFTYSLQELLPHWTHMILSMYIAQFSQVTSARMLFFLPFRGGEGLHFSRST